MYNQRHQTNIDMIPQIGWIMHQFPVHTIRASDNHAILELHIQPNWDHNMSTHDKCTKIEKTCRESNPNIVFSLNGRCSKIPEVEVQA